ncbi:hypothetical protein L1987_61140 [Smallanthus sonchifolius]|uniref:Uncharacterized protein n=1 Tax=Smallanthus sonchifolius TaxID=185202 RepID=A0ACB9DA90_9ASTR|nr:hypothetical protein L1987_61140 [Smallanthus sonchifolius]
MFTPVKPDKRIQEFYHEERDALIPFRDSMKSSYNLHTNWIGPPCRNNMSRWTGITCSNSHVTRTLPVGFLQNVTFLSKLSFYNNAITGDLPLLTNLRHLKYIFLSGNQFSGPVPSDYVYLANLTALELQENEITGTIPPFDQESLTSLNLSYNQLSGPIPETKILERFESSSFDHNPGLCGRPLETPCVVSPPSSPSDDKKPLKVRGIVLIAAGTVIKSISSLARKSQWSASTDDPEKTVDLEFFDKQKRGFDLDELLRASAESSSSHKVPHGNLKSSNILVDFTNETARAKLTDFGYLPLLPSQKSKLAIAKCPEFMDGKKLTHKSDVYSLGMLLLEVITGKSTGDNNSNNNHEDLSDWVRGVVIGQWIYLTWKY